jgi:hypothetical protein
MERVVLKCVPYRPCKSAPVNSSMNSSPYLRAGVLLLLQAFLIVFNCNYVAKVSNGVSMV